MKELSKRLKEVDCILNKLDDEYMKKIPKEVLDYINENMDKNYQVNYYEEKTLVEQNLNIDTISILTYINTEFVLEGEPKEKLLDLLKKDELISEQEKISKYNPDDLFKKKNQNNIEKPQNAKENTSMVVVQEQRWYQKIFNIIKEIFKRN